MTLTQRLRAAKKLVIPKFRWIKGAMHRERWNKEKGKFEECYCTVGALRRASGADWGGAYLDMKECFMQANGIKKNIEDWNDRSERTHESVVRAFDKAIARAEKLAQK